MSNIIDVTPKIDKEISIIYFSLTQSLNGLTVREAKQMLDRIKLRLISSPIVNFNPLETVPIYDFEPCRDS